MKNLLLVGCGAEIGSMLVGMLNPNKDGMRVKTILTNHISKDATYPDLAAVDSLYARIILAQPHLLGDVSVDRENDALVVRGDTIPIYWGDITTYDLTLLPHHYDACIVATSKKHVNDVDLMTRLTSVSEYVVGVAEGTSLPALYPCLIGTPEAFLPVKASKMVDQRTFCLGSCQTNGWQAQLRGILELANNLEFTTLEFKAMEVDIIHPDTPTGCLGTKSISAREQDPRNNLRPSFSQVEASMNRLFPQSNNVNTISLRTLVMPPGYQICRFFFRYSMPDGRRLQDEDIVKSLRATADQYPYILDVADHPLGSRGFEFTESAAVVLPQPALFRYADDQFGMGYNEGLPISELILQSYVHNTRAYCRSVIESLRYIMTDSSPMIFPN